MIPDIFPSCCRHLPGGEAAFPGTDAGDAGGFAAVLKGLKASGGKRPAPPEAVSGRGAHGMTSRPGRYLEALRKGFLSRGKSLDRITVDLRDIGPLRTFLRRCGLSGQKADHFIRSLKEGHPDGGIRASALLRKLEMLFRSEKERGGSVALDIQAVPYLEASLRDAGLTPQEIQEVFNAGRLPDKRIDVKRIVTKLKSFLSGPGRDGSTERPQGDSPTAAAARGQGRKDPDRPGKTDAVLKELIFFLERKSGGSNGNGGLPAEVSSAIGRIVDRAVADAGREKPAVRISTGPSPDPGDRRTIKKARGNGDRDVMKGGLTVSPKKGKAPQPAGTDTVARPGEKTGPAATPGESASGGIPHGEKNVPDPASIHGPKGISASYPSGPHANSSESTGTEAPVDTAQAPIDRVSRPSGGAPSGARPLVPPYISRQAGTQIAKGLLRGDRKVRLQLHPPELGSIKVEMDVKDHVLKIAMTAENSSVKDALQSGIRELREALVDNGVGFEGVDIRIGYESGRSGEGSGSPWGREGDGFEGPEVMALTGEGDEPDLSFSRRGGDRIVDLVA